MSSHRRLFQILSVTVILSMLFSVFSMPSVSAQGPDGIERHVNVQTGKVSFIGPESGQALSAAKALGIAAPSGDPALALAKRFAPEFGLTDPARELAQIKSSQSKDGRLTTRYQQNYQSIPVMGGELIVNTNRNGDLYSMNGEVSSDLSLSTQPKVTAEQARQTALQAVAKWNQQSPEDFSASEPELWIYDESLLRPSTRPAELVWRMDVTARDEGLPVRELVLVDAQRGGISLHFNQIDTAWSLAANSGTAPDDAPTPTPLPTEAPVASETPLPTESAELAATAISTEEPVSVEGPSAVEPSIDKVEALTAATWYVATTGSDSNSCSTKENPCQTINAAIAKAIDGDQIYVASGIYKNSDPGSSPIVVTIPNKQVSLYGGWDPGFLAQTGNTILDAEKKYQGISVWSNSPPKTITLDHFQVRNGSLGGVYFSHTNLILTNSSIYNNSKVGFDVNGGGIEGNYGNLTARNVTITNNTTSGDGGAIYIDQGIFNLNNLTITNNTGDGGVVAFVGGTHTDFRIRNSILFGNRSASSAADCPPSDAIVDHTIIGDNSDCTVTATNGNQLNVNPKLVRFIEGAGYQPLLSGSPAINAGSNCYGTADQRGVGRVGICDIGAYEYDSLGLAAKVVIATGDNQRAAPNISFTNPLYVAVLDDNGSPLSGQTVTFQSPSSGPGGLFVANGNNSLTVTTGSDGIAPAAVKANPLLGRYMISATASVGAVSFNLENRGFYISNNGNDTNDCRSPQQACLTINAALGKAEDGDTLLVAIGTYTNTGVETQVVSIRKNVTIEGGWDPSFMSQSGYSTIDGEKTRAGVSVNQYITATMRRFVIQNGASYSGAGIYNSGMSLTIDQFTIKDSAARSDGGAIYSWGTLIVKNSLIRNNTAVSYGGGIDSWGPLMISNSAIFDNTAGYGGGIYGSSVSLNNVTVVDNSAIFIGGGINSPYGKVRLNNVTIANNKASEASGGITFGGASVNFKMQNSILANNSSGRSPDCSGELSSQGYNIVSSTSGCTIPIAGGDQFNTNPQLGILLPALGTLPLLPGSPAIDHGNPATCLPTDQRGVARSGRCDVGAYEYTIPLSPSSIIVAGGAGQRTAPNLSFMFPLQVAVVDVNGSPVGGVPVNFTAPDTGPSATFQNDSPSVSLNTGAGGIAATTLKANSLPGSYNVTISTAIGSVNINFENAAWYVSPTGNNTNDCLSPGSACSTLREALQRAYANDTIVVASGAYGDTGTEVLTIDKDIRISGGWDASFTTQYGFSAIDGESTRHGLVVPAGVTASLDRFIVENAGNNVSNKTGVTNAGLLTLNHCDIRYNSSVGISNGVIGRIALNNCLVRYNARGGISNEGNLTINNTSIIYNWSDNPGGQYSSLGQGGGIYNDSLRGPGIVSINNSFVAHNRAFDGGAIYNAGTVQITNTSINNNIAESLGGGITNHGTATLANVSVVGNRAIAGGGIWTENSLVSNNSTISVNTAMRGGGIFVSATFGNARLKNTILAGNTLIKIDNGSMFGPDCSGTLLSMGSNIVGNTSSCTVTLSTGDRVNINPQLGVFLPSEGYIPLLPTSPAVNSGNPTTCLATDQRGMARPQGARCDIGAYEYAVPGPLAKLEVVGGSEQLTLFNTTFRKALQVAALDAKGSPVSGVSVSFQAPSTSPTGKFAGTNTNTAVVTTNSGGVAQPPSFTADGIMGTYYVIASAAGVPSKSITLHNGPWLVVPAANGGNDANDCMNVGTACANLSTVLSKGAFQEGDPVWMSVGTYGNPDDQAAIDIGKAVNVYGGWNTGFTQQIGTSVIQDTLQIGFVPHMELERLTVQNTGSHGIATSADLTVRQVTVRNNPGTGIISDGQLVVINSTVTQNGDNEIGGAVSSNGGIFNTGYYPGSMTTILNSTITNNKGDSIGGVGNYSSSAQPVRIQNSIIFGNTALYFGPSDCSGKLVSNGYNIVGHVDHLCEVTWQSTDKIGVNPMLAGLQDLGNNVWVRPLLWGSPAIDGGPWNCSPIDQRGVARPQGGTCDIGAFEYVFQHNLDSLLITTYNAGNTSNTARTKVCDQTDLSCAAGDAQAKAAHKYAAGTYNFYKNAHNRNSLDGNGIEILSSVHYGSNYQNAFWNGHMLVYGDKFGYPLADDVVAHEFTHGVTQYESNLFPYYQSGAISESFSDLWGEYYDQSNSQGNDAAGVKWLIGEDVSGQGAVRSMSNPPAYGDPDKISSTNYHIDAADSGGIHHNSGVNNKAVFLMVNGGTFNGKTVTSLGWVKTAAIYYEVNTNLLSSGADYSDLYYALQQACQNLIGQKGITTANCTEVKDAVDAVQMNGQPVSNFNPHAPLCTAAGTVPLITFADDLEAGTKKWTFNNGIYLRWQYDSPYGPYAQSGSHSLYANDYPDAVTDASARLASLVVPANAYLHFAHAYDFETGYLTGDPRVHNFDGGVLEYSITNGSTWLDAGSLIDYNGYKGKIFQGVDSPWVDNPLKDRLAFVGSSHGYISTRLNLASLAGKTITFRWRIGMDGTGYAWGWWVDNIKLYTCKALPGAFTKTSPTNGAANQAGNLTLSWGASSGATSYQFCYDTTNDNACTNWVNNDTSTSKVMTGLSSSTTYYWHVRAVNSGGSTYANGSPTAFWWFTTMSPPGAFNKSSPTNGSTGVSLDTTLSWNSAPFASSYQYCYDLVDDNQCNRTWTSTAETSAQITNLGANTTYYWQVRAINPIATTYADAESWGSFTTTSALPIGASAIEVFIGTNQQGKYSLTQGQSLRESFLGANNGPAKIVSTNAIPVIGAERVVYKVNNVNTSFTEMMGLPNSQLDTTYWLPWYNNVDLDTQLRIANVSNAAASVHIFIGGEEVTLTSITLEVGESTRVSYAGVNNGPVQIVSDQPIVAAERVIYKVNGVNTSFSEMMALPNGQLDTIYWLPWYNNVDLDTQMRIANVTDLTATVHVFIGTNEVTPPEGLTLLTGESQRVSYVGVNNGPVKIVSDQPIVAAERVIYKVNGINTSFSEMMGLPNSLLDTTYWLPWYNNVDLDTQLRIGNVSDSTATLHIFIGTTEVTPAEGLTLLTSESTRLSFTGVNNGPVRIVSNVPIVAAERVIYKVEGKATSYSEMIGLPGSLLDVTYWLPWYNNVDLDTQLRFGMP